MGFVTIAIYIMMFLIMCALAIIALMFGIIGGSIILAGKIDKSKKETISGVVVFVIALVAGLLAFLIYKEL